MNEINFLEQRYQNCLSILESQANLEQLEFVRSELSDLGDYSDAKRMLMICLNRIEELRAEQIVESQKQEQLYSQNIQETVQRYKNKRVRILIILSLVVIGTLTGVILLSSASKKDAQKLLIGKSFMGYYSSSSGGYFSSHPTHQKSTYTVKIIDDTYCELDYVFELSFYTGDQRTDQKQTHHTVCKYRITGLLFSTYLNWEGSDEIRAANQDFKISVKDGKLVLFSKDYHGASLTLSEEAN